MKKRIAVMSYVKPKLVEAVRNLGFETIETAAYKEDFSNPESTHADMQILSLPNREVFLLRDNGKLNDKIIDKLNDNKVFYTKNTIEKFKYPDCILLNTAVVGKYAIANFRFCDKKLTEYLKTLGYICIDVKQGYAKCSVSIVSDNAVITSDLSIADAVRKYGIDVLQISSGGIELCDRYGGFIGGASFLADKNTLAFTGDITKHRDCEAIEKFCQKHGVKTVSLTDEALFDIGGVVII